MKIKLTMKEFFDLIKNYYLKNEKIVNVNVEHFMQPENYKASNGKIISKPGHYILTELEMDISGKHRYCKEKTRLEGIKISDILTAVLKEEDLVFVKVEITNNSVVEIYYKEKYKQQASIISKKLKR